MNKLIIIYGSPRTATSFTLGCLVQHPYCYGEVPDTNTTLEYKTNENQNIPVNALNKGIGNYKEIERLFDIYQVPEYAYLVIKAPGYCMAWDYFNNSPFDCKYIYTVRSPYGVIKSMLDHEDSLEIIKRPIESTDCPRNKINFYKKLWNESNFEGKAYLRYHWHVNSIHPDMLKKSLVLDQYQTKSVQPKKQNITYQLVMSYLQLKDDEAVKNGFTLFRYKKLNTQLRQEIKNKSYNVIQTLGEF
jgi:hypothetical protein